MENKTRKLTAAGILSIIAGATGVVGGIVIAVLDLATGRIPLDPLVSRVFVEVAIVIVLTVPLIILGIVAIAGGIYALKRKKWGLSLAGSICSLICVFFLGIPAVIFVITRKDEFESSV